MSSLYEKLHEAVMEKLSEKIVEEVIESLDLVMLVEEIVDRVERGATGSIVDQISSEIIDHMVSEFEYGLEELPCTLEDILESQFEGDIS